MSVCAHSDCDSIRKTSVCCGCYYLAINLILNQKTIGLWEMLSMADLIYINVGSFAISLTVQDRPQNKWMANKIGPNER